MFRVVVVVGAAAAPVIIAGLVISPLAALIVLGLELGVGIGLLWQSARGSEPRNVEVAHSDDGVFRLLVVANETVGGRALLEEIRSRCAKHERAEIFVMTPPLAASRASHLASDVDGAIEEARRRLEASLRTMEAAGLHARGDVGDHHDVHAAIEDALQRFPADEVIISTHPPERSRWLELGVVEKASRDLPLPITHVVVDLEAESTEQAMQL
jgi:hypothetical protein